MRFTDPIPSLVGGIRHVAFALIALAFCRAGNPPSKSSARKRRTCEDGPLSRHPLIWAVWLALILPAVAHSEESWIGLEVLKAKPMVLADRDGDTPGSFELKGSLIPVLEDKGGRLRIRDYAGR